MSSNSNFTYTDNIINKNHLTNKLTNVEIFLNSLRNPPKNKIKVAPKIIPALKNARDNESILLKRSLFLPAAQAKIKINSEKTRAIKIINAIKKIQNNRILQTQIQKNKVSKDELMAIFRTDFEKDGEQISQLDEGTLNNIKGIIQQIKPREKVPETEDEKKAREKEEYDLRIEKEGELFERNRERMETDEKFKEDEKRRIEEEKKAYTTIKRNKILDLASKKITKVLKDEKSKKFMTEKGPALMDDYKKFYADKIEETRLEKEAEEFRTKQKEEQKIKDDAMRVKYPHEKFFSKEFTPAKIIDSYKNFDDRNIEKASSFTDEYKLLNRLYSMRETGIRDYFKTAGITNPTQEQILKISAKTLKSEPAKMFEILKTFEQGKKYLEEPLAVDVTPEEEEEELSDIESISDIRSSKKEAEELGNDIINKITRGNPKFELPKTEEGAKKLFVDFFKTYNPKDRTNDRIFKHVRNLYDFTDYMKTKGVYNKSGLRFNNMIKFAINNNPEKIYDKLSLMGSFNKKELTVDRKNEETFEGKGFLKPQDKMYRYPPMETPYFPKNFSGDGIYGDGIFDSILGIGKTILKKLLGVGKTILKNPENIMKVISTGKKVYDAGKNVIGAAKEKNYDLTRKMGIIIPELLSTAKQVYDTGKDINDQTNKTAAEGNGLKKMRGGQISNEYPLLRTIKGTGTNNLLRTIKGTGHVKYYKLH